MRRSLSVVGLALACTGLMAGCGTATPPSASGPVAPTSTGTTTATPAPDQARVADPGDLLVGSGMLMQRSANGPVELCVGGVAESYPPQCGGPRIVGDVDWDALEPERASGVTWTNDVVWAVGRLDPDAGESGTFTLERPLSLTPPKGFPLPTPAPVTFPQLCDDPYAGGGRRGGGSPDAQNALGERLTSLDGYIGSWVSDGSSLYNVLVTGDADAAHAALRKVWKGGLCVEQRDLPTEADVRAAQEALGTKVEGLLGSGGDVTQGKLDVHVTVLDSRTRDLVIATVSPWLQPDDVRITSTFQPLER